MYEKIPDSQWPSIDANIVANLKLPAIKDIRAIAGCRLHEALDIFVERYDRLRAESPERFNCTPEEYWEEFYS